MPRLIFYFRLHLYLTSIKKNISYRHRQGTFEKYDTSVFLAYCSSKSCWSRFCSIVYYYKKQLCFFFSFLFYLLTVCDDPSNVCQLDNYSYARQNGYDCFQVQNQLQFICTCFGNHFTINEPCREFFEE